MTSSSAPPLNSRVLRASPSTAFDIQKTAGVYSRAKLTLHIPRQQYNSAMSGIPTIRVFEALACGIPLISAPWQDSEHLFRGGDFCVVENAAEMASKIRALLEDRDRAREQARCGLETVLARHTCDDRAKELTGILEEVSA
jgi:spore maturation protein CgeB